MSLDLKGLNYQALKCSIWTSHLSAWQVLFYSILFSVLGTVPEALSQKQPFLLFSVQGAQQRLFLQEHWAHRGVTEYMFPSPTWALSLWLLCAAQGRVVFPAPALPPCLGCRTHSSLLQMMWGTAQKGRLRAAAGLGYRVTGSTGEAEYAGKTKESHCLAQMHPPNLGNWTGF